MQRQDFHYDLPPELIAQTPLPGRSDSRLLAVGDAQDPHILRDLTIRELPGLLAAGDLLVFNDTRVIAARLLGEKPSGGRVELLLERAVGESCEALAQLRTSKRVRSGLEVATAGGTVRILREIHPGLWLIATPSPAVEYFERWGEVPLPPYIRRAPEASDRDRYQSIFARERGAVAAPTASLHFDASLVSQIKARGVDLTFVTLHVGAGTFQPLRSDDLDSHVMHGERVSVSAAACEAIQAARAAGGRVIGVGTTVVRALESAALASASGTAQSWSGETRLFIRPGFQFRVVDALLTNFHLPQSTLLMLVCAFAGSGPVLAAYRHAVRQRYRFFSYGDAMFISQRRQAP